MLEIKCFGKSEKDAQRKLESIHVNEMSRSLFWDRFLHFVIPSQITQIADIVTFPQKRTDFIDRSEAGPLFTVGVY